MYYKHKLMLLINKQSSIKLNIIMMKVEDKDFYEWSQFNS